MTEIAIKRPPIESDFLMDDTFHKVEEHLREMLPPRERARPIKPETELYRDLGMYGDVIAFDVILWATREFGVEGKFQLPDYVPGEYPFPGQSFWKLLGKLTGKQEPRYKSLTVRDIVTAIEKRRWPD
jgi:hypothetical protein